MTTLTGKVAIVTGGNSGIGKAIVLALAEEGANIVIDYVANEQATEDLEKQVAALGDQSIGVEADVSKVEDLERLVKSAVDAFGRLDIMVNNAGIETRTSILDTTEAQYEKVMEINLKSAFFGTQLAAKQMIAQGDGGRIINITSVHEDWPMPGNTPYCLSKGGMRMLTRTAGVELGPHGVTVVGVGPGAVATPINTSTMNDPEKMATLDAAIPLGRMAQPDEIGSVVAFLAGDGASYLTGDDDLRRRRHHALQPRPVADGRGDDAAQGGRRRRRLRWPARHPLPRPPTRRRHPRRPPQPPPVPTAAVPGGDGHALAGADRPAAPSRGTAVQERPRRAGRGDRVRPRPPDRPRHHRRPPPGSGDPLRQPHRRRRRQPVVLRPRRAGPLTRRA